MKALLLLATLAGLAVAAWLIGAVGAQQVLHSVGAVGWGGFALLCVYSMIIFTLLGLAWWVVSPDLPLSTLPAFLWGRMTREASADILPFSQFGGLVIGGRTVTSCGIPSGLAYSGMIADMTTEMASQLIFTLFGIGALVLTIGKGPEHDQILTAAYVGAGLAVLTLVAFAVFQRPMIDFAGRIGSRMLPGSVAAATDVRLCLDRVYRMPGRVAASFLLNLLAWIASGIAAWIALRLMGADIAPGKAIVIECLIFTLRSVAFMIPGAIGLQEGAYVLIAPLFGLTPEMALGLSLLKRARDLALGLPALILWQVAEGRSLMRRRPSEPAA